MTTSTSRPPETHHEHRSSLWRWWLRGWLGALVIGFLNGTARQTYTDRLGEQRAHRVSTLTFVGPFALYVRWLGRRRPLPTIEDALKVGATWALGTVAFDFLFGHFVGGQPWASLRHDWNLRRGRLWPLVVGVVAAGPALWGRDGGPRRTR